MPFDWHVYAIAAAVTVFAYFIFGITAFGASLFTAPVLAFFLPQQFVLPVTTMLDVVASLALGLRFGKATDRAELAWMLPFMIAGAVTGALLLVRLPRDTALATFGVFLLAYGAYTLWQPPAGRPISRKWALFAGYTGGTMGTLFGVGGAPYAIYLSRRIEDKVALRTTLSSLVLLSVTVGSSCSPCRDWPRATAASRPPCSPPAWALACESATRSTAASRASRSCG
jgi:uncharacterized protein